MKCRTWSSVFIEDPWSSLGAPLAVESTSMFGTCQSRKRAGQRVRVTKPERRVGPSARAALSGRVLFRCDAHTKTGADGNNLAKLAPQPIMAAVDGSKEDGGGKRARTRNVLIARAHRLRSAKITSVVQPK